MGLDIIGMESYFLKCPEIRYLFIVLPASSDNFKSVKKIMKDIEISKIILLALGLYIEWKQAHFLKGLKIRYLFIFSSVWSDNFKPVKKKKKKKNIDKSKIIFFGSEFEYRWEVDLFSKMPRIYVSIHIFVGLLR